VQTRGYPVVQEAQEAWQDALVGFAAALREFECRRARVVVSHHFVQFRLIAGRNDLANETEYQALAQLEFAAAFGAMAQDWAIGLSDESPGLPRVASALPKALLAALVSASNAANVKLLAVKPYLAVMADSWARTLSIESCSWLMLHEPGRLCVVARGAGQWRWVRPLRVGDDWQEKLLEILQIEAHLAGLEASPDNTHVCAPSATRQTRESLRGAGFKVMEQTSECGFISDRDGAFAPAWLG
jgi:hypothetical protein